MSPMNKGIPSTLPQGAPPVRHYLQFTDLNRDEYDYLLERVAFIKAKFKRFERHLPLVDRTLAMIFEKASTRTSWSASPRTAACRSSTG